MSSVVQFVRRHKYKLLVGGMAVGGALAIAEKIWQAADEEKRSANGKIREEICTNTQLRNEARRHYVFDTNQRSCDESIMTLAASLIALIKSKHDVDLLKDELKYLTNLTQEKRLQFWDMIKRSTITRLVVVAYGYSLLIITLKTQISLMARDICNQFETPKTAGWNDYLPKFVSDYLGSETQPQTSSMDDIMNKQIFLQCIQYFTTKGVLQLMARIEDLVKIECSSLNLKDEMSRQSVEDLFERIMDQVISGRLSDYIAPMEESNGHSEDKVMQLLHKLKTNIDSKRTQDTVKQLVTFFIHAVYKDLPSSAPLAKLLPVLADSFYKISKINTTDSLIHESLCSSEVHQFAVAMFNS